MKELAIKVDGVSKSYNGKLAVKGLSFEVDKAVCFGLLGPNGAGKTTMMKMLYGVTERDDPVYGQINIFGFDPLNNDLEIKFISGIVPQEDNLDVELSVIQNLMIYSGFYSMPKKKAKNRIEYLLEFMELEEKKNSRIKELSGGMKRRLIIARAMINSPQLLILDEPTTGLDPQVRHLIWDKLRMLKKEGVTILLTTHYMEEAFQLCDNLIIMYNGGKILEGIPSGLIKDNIETYVLEIYNMESPDNVKLPENIRVECTESRVLMYSRNLTALEDITKQYKAKDFYLRQSNLEDLFLKITGRRLNE